MPQKNGLGPGRGNPVPAIGLLLLGLGNGQAAEQAARHRQRRMQVPQRHDHGGHGRPGAQFALVRPVDDDLDRRVRLPDHGGDRLEIRRIVVRLAPAGKKQQAAHGISFENS